jgi:hypothetical protein
VVVRDPYPRNSPACVPASYESMHAESLGLFGRCSRRLSKNTGKEERETSPTALEIVVLALMSFSWGTRACRHFVVQRCKVQSSSRSHCAARILSFAFSLRAERCRYSSSRLPHQSNIVSKGKFPSEIPQCHREEKRLHCGEESLEKPPQAP